MSTPSPDAAALAAEALDQLSRSRAIVSQAAAQIEQSFPTLSRAQRAELVNDFRRLMLPPRKRGRPPQKTITKALELWRLGVRGPELFQASIPGFQMMGAWRQKVESRRLLEALRVRRRREKDAAVQNRTEI